MGTIPIFLSGAEQHVLIAGAGEGALAKLALMAGTGAAITLVAPGAAEAVQTAGLADAAQLIVQDRAPLETDLDGKTLLYIDGDDQLAQERLLRAARRRGMPANVVDRPAKSSFITPAQFSRGPLQVAFSSGGLAPVFVRRLRALLEGIVPKSLGVLAAAAGAAKDDIKRLLPGGTQRRLFWDSVFDDADGFAGLSQRDAESALTARARAAASADNEVARKVGLVQLVGAGPGDPELLTIKAHRALQRADVILYDRLVSREVLSLARRDATLIFVGKTKGEHGVGQDGIQALMIRHAKAGRRVVRLKSGDPLTFARAGEEITALRAADIPFAVIPGITALSGIAAAAGMPVTDRAASSALTLVTGQTKDGDYGGWADLAGAGKSLAIYMGLAAAPRISRDLQLGGLAGQTPVAVVENGTRPDERRLYTTLAELPALIAEHSVVSPALIIIGDVVKMADDFELSPAQAHTGPSVFWQSLAASA